MGLKEVKSNDLVTMEFLKEARILKRQLQLMKKNINHISKEDLIKILIVNEVLEKEINELRRKSKVMLELDEK